MPRRGNNYRLGSSVPRDRALRLLILTIKACPMPFFFFLAILYALRAALLKDYAFAFSPNGPLGPRREPSIDTQLPAGAGGEQVGDLSQRSSWHAAEIIGVLSEISCNCAATWLSSILFRKAKSCLMLVLIFRLSRRQWHFFPICARVCFDARRRALRQTAK